MAEKKIRLLDAYFTSTGFYVETIHGDDDGEKPEDAQIDNWCSAFQQNNLEALFHLGFLIKEPWFSPALTYLYSLADLLIQKLSHMPEIELVREAAEPLLAEDEAQRLIDEVPFAVGMEYVNQQWIAEQWKGMLAVFRSEIKSYEGAVAQYMAEHNSQISVAGRVFFHLVENKDEQYPFAFMATYSIKPVKSKKAIHTPLRHALQEFSGDDKKLLELMTTVSRAAESSDFISDLMESGELFSPLKFSSEDAYTFLREIPRYEEAGIMCRVPNWWRKKSNTIKMSVTIGEDKPSVVGLDALLRFSPTLTVDGEEMTLEQLRSFLSMAEGLVQYKGKWIEIDKKKLEEALSAFERVATISADGGLTMAEAMRMELDPGRQLGILEDEIEIQITSGTWLRQMKEKMLQPQTIDAVAVMPTFHAQLREYQNLGYQWLHVMQELGFGACLADDMGLGKTVQVIALLEYIRINQGGKALLVLPASLIGNWQNEIDRFAPEMTYQILHRSTKGDDSQPVGTDFLAITTYGMAARMEELQNTSWDLLILDEAQAIKNAGTKQSKAIKSIPAKTRIAMTGTPIENNLGDLWSLFDFLNQGLLGSMKEFQTFAKKLSQDGMGYSKLRKMINPFILRRLKTDKSIISDLPDKIEIREYAALTQKQVVLYEKVLNEILKKLERSEGIERKGLVLASIMKCKQICNHPDQYLGLDDFKVNQSGKFEQLQEICETIYQKRERVLVFTQFREMTEPLAAMLSQVFERDGLVLHGGTPVKSRNEMVKKFNSTEYVPFMVLSLKAGGVGLNLTAANHVIHFDRWWNPAVENQATDRAFRIGQTKNVMVHKFVTKGTIEEKIDAMIAEKQQMAGDILATSGEKWITELDNRELRALFTLGGER